eukprot:CAMPEP_0206132414 /NCGR_PEP_ID=MMETSP1472-20131121/49284_1 /ASSEMBLY_ACC=CAM_ASM_001108 /TAXON_ID=41880 /ORGANISM="Pycnococcus provasolii, Strain RCC251" /LENGTH=64 /DNA_ID=CAMNT_0053523921 /DNA_START=245 /DNA_END=436 /DNA_ORIENTATION=-
MSSSSWMESSAFFQDSHGCCGKERSASESASQNASRTGARSLETICAASLSSARGGARRTPPAD